MTKDQELFVQIYRNGEKALESYESLSLYYAALSLYEEIRDSKIKDAAQEIIRGLDEWTNHYSDSRLLAALKSWEDHYIRIQKPDTSLHIDESENGFAQGCLDIYQLYLNHDILFSEAGPTILNLAKMGRERHYNEDLCRTMDSLGHALSIGMTSMMIEPVETLKAFLKRKSPEEKIIPVRTHLRDILYLIPENTFLKICCFEKPVTDLRKRILYEDLLSYREIPSALLDQPVISIEPKYDEAEDFALSLEVWLLQEDHS